VCLKVNPNIKKEKWSPAEDDRLLVLYEEHGGSWAQISRHLEVKLHSTFNAFTPLMYCPYLPMMADTIFYSLMRRTQPQLGPKICHQEVTQWLWHAIITGRGREGGRGVLEQR